VLRANPIVLAERLKQKGFPPQKIKENVEAETLDIILAEAIELCEVVYEVDRSGKSIEEVAPLVRAIIDAELEGESVGRNALREKYKPGSVDWTGHLTVTPRKPLIHLYLLPDTLYLFWCCPFRSPRSFHF